MRRFAKPEEFLGIRTDGDSTGSLNSVANTTINRCGDTRADLYVDAGSLSETGTDQRQDDRRGWNDAGSECRDAIYCSPGYGRELYGVSDAVGEVQRN